MLVGKRFSVPVAKRESHSLDALGWSHAAPWDAVLPRGGWRQITVEESWRAEQISCEVVVRKELILS